jgi:hypothetical protein
MASFKGTRVLYKEWMLTPIFTTFPSPVFFPLL